MALQHEEMEFDSLVTLHVGTEQQESTAAIKDVTAENRETDSEKEFEANAAAALLQLKRTSK